jgi:hypothetical protein
MPTLFSEGTVGMDVRWMQNKAVITKTKPDLKHFIELQKNLYDQARQAAESEKKKSDEIGFLVVIL